ncbi:cytidine deaminase [Aureibaculum sp. 2210JD6-5]|uniref:cytidine deaminase n=1 Tax=Aureibaculum sp. 2210JD6-5 TaxID=3103957 RepID=UPI002AAC5E8A|nr:cytidine deaminase [Aureibaculum sp. 2210JD6-5]MDY7395404.1 cytidine deaminase [Aureibaculum sp. 2210JD6-5]
MQKIESTTEYTVYNTIDELDSVIKNLMNSAIEARGNAYAPYSNFNVGAAILLDNNQVVVGNNQENAAFPSGLCAERVAIYNAGANYPQNKIKIIAISAASAKHKVNKPVGPCGACRQSIAEYENKQKQAIEIYFMGEVGQIVKVNSLKDLLPFGFDGSLL